MPLIGIIKFMFITKLEEEIQTKPGAWSHTKVGVYQIEKDPEDDSKILNEKRVGEYLRNYRNKGPFYPFKKDGNWYALYSKDYMYTRVMSLPDCKDLGGEDKSNTPYNEHFCPREYYVPEVCVQDFKKGEVDPRPYNPRHDPDKWCDKNISAGYTHYTWPDDSKSTAPESFKDEYKQALLKSDLEYREWYNRHPFVHKYLELGFVSGCFWGDDSSDKLEVFDLSQVEKGIIKRDQRFGYFVLPAGVKLKDALDFDSIDIDNNSISDMSVTIARPFRIQLDGSYSGWWTDEKFERIKKKYKDVLHPEQVEELKQVFTVFYKNGLDDSSITDEVHNQIDKIIKIFLRPRPISFFKRIIKRYLKN